MKLKLPFQARGLLLAAFAGLALCIGTLLGVHQQPRLYASGPPVPGPIEAGGPTQLYYGQWPATALSNGPPGAVFPLVDAAGAGAIPYLDDAGFGHSTPITAANAGQVVGITAVGTLVPTPMANPGTSPGYWGGSIVYTCLNNTATGAFGAATGSGVMRCCSDVPLCYIDQPITDAWEQIGTTSSANANNDLQAALDGGGGGENGWANYAPTGTISLQQVGNSVEAFYTDTANFDIDFMLKAMPLNTDGGVYPPPYSITVAGTLLGTLDSQYSGFGAAFSNGITSATSYFCVGGSSVITEFLYEYDNHFGFGETCLGANQGAGGLKNSYKDIAAAGWTSGAGVVWQRLLYDGSTYFAQFSQDGLQWATIYNVANSASGAFSTPTYYGFELGWGPLSAYVQSEALIQRLYLAPHPKLTISSLTCNNTIATITTTTALSTVGLVSGHGVSISGVVLTDGSVPVCEYSCGNGNAGCGVCFNTNLKGFATVTSSTTFTVPWTSSCNYSSGGTVVDLSL